MLKLSDHNKTIIKQELVTYYIVDGTVIKQTDQRTFNERDYTDYTSKEVLYARH